MSSSPLRHVPPEGSPIDRTSSYRWRGDADGFEGHSVGEVEPVGNLRTGEGEASGGSASIPSDDLRTRGSGPRVHRSGLCPFDPPGLRRVVLSNMGATPQQHLHSRQFWRKVQGYSDSEAARVHTFSLVCSLISRPLGHIILKKGEYRRDHGVRLMRVRSTQQLEPWPTTRRGGILVAGSGVRPKQTLTIVFPLPVVSPTHHPAITPTTNQHEHDKDRLARWILLLRRTRGRTSS